MLHDESVIALSFLENAPERVKHSFATEKALKIMAHLIGWVKDFDLAQKYNFIRENTTINYDLGTPLIKQNNVKNN